MLLTRPRKHLLVRWPDLVFYIPHWLHCSLFSRISYHYALANCFIPDLYDSILDLEHHSHDFWIPFLGRNGFQTMLQSIGLIEEPLEFLLDFSIVLAFVHLYALFGGADLQQHDAHRSFFN